MDFLHLFTNLLVLEIMPSYLLYFALFFSALTFLFTLFLYLQYKDTKIKETEVEIKGQRDRIEQHLYDWREIMQSSPNRFFDTNKLVLQSSIDSDDTINSKIPNYSYFTKMGVDVNNVLVNNKSVLCLMPFNKRFQKTYDVISDVCRKTGIKCLRSDEPYNPGNLLRQILTQMFESQFVIAVLDGQNPNVFYELGIAHSIGKTVILLASISQVDEIPFDLSSDRLLLYSNNFELRKQLTKAINSLYDKGK